MSQIRDIILAPSGHERIRWAKSYMPLLAELERTLAPSKPLKGKKVAVSVHLEAKTARLCLLLRELGAELAVTGSNPLSTRDDIAAALVDSGINVYAWYDATPGEYVEHLRATLAFGPDIVIDDGGDFLSLLHGELSSLAPAILGGCEETTTGVLRMRARDNEGSLRFPMIAVNDADCKHLFDNRFGTGQSVWDAIMRSTNLVVSGKTVVVAGYGYCGKGVAEKARGLGAKVIITEINPVRAIEAAMEGYTVLSMNDAAPLGDVFVTVTSCCDVITTEHILSMKNGALLSNAGHFDVEIDVRGLEEMAVLQQPLRKDIVGYTLSNGKTVCLIAQGRLVNICAGDGHPVEIMDMSFAVQALSVLYINKHHQSLGPHVYSVTREIDEFVARLKLETMGLSIDQLTQKQKDYLTSHGE